MSTSFIGAATNSQSETEQRVGGCGGWGWRSSSLAVQLASCCVSAGSEGRSAFPPSSNSLNVSFFIIIIIFPSFTRSSERSLFISLSVSLRNRGPHRASAGFEGNSEEVSSCQLPGLQIRHHTPQQVRHTHFKLLSS